MGIISRILVTALVIALILVLIGERKAASHVIDLGLSIVKWIVIVGAIIGGGVLVFYRSSKND